MELGTRSARFVFDCTTKRLIHLNRCAAIRNLYPVQQSLVLKDRLFVLQHVRYSPDDDTNRYVISEFTWESSRSDMNKLNDYEFAMRDVEDTDNVTMFVGTELILTAWNIQSRNEYVRFLLLKLYNISAGEWHDLPPLVCVPKRGSRRLFHVRAPVGCQSLSKYQAAILVFISGQLKLVEVMSLEKLTVACDLTACDLTILMLYNDVSLDCTD